MYGIGGAGGLSERMSKDKKVQGRIRQRLPHSQYPGNLLTFHRPVQLFTIMLN